MILRMNWSEEPRATNATRVGHVNGLPMPVLTQERILFGIG